LQRYSTMNIDAKIISAIVASSRNLDRANGVIFARFNLTATGREILQHIGAGLSTTTALAKVMDNTLGNITHKTKALEQAGYIQRSYDKLDKRVWHFGITDSGRAALAMIETIYSAALRQLFSEFPDTRKQQVFSFLDQMQSHLDHLLTAHKPEFIQFVDDLINKHGAK